MKKEFFVNNRVKLFNKMEDNSICVLFANVPPRKSGDENYIYTPNRNFYYITGIDEPKDIVILIKRNGQCSVKAFIQRFDERLSKWVGKTFDANEVEAKSGITDIGYIDEYCDYVDANLKGIKTVYVDYELDDYKDCYEAYELATHVTELNKKIKVVDVFPILAALRNIKEDCEIEEMRKAIEITNNGLKKIMKSLKNAKTEKEMEALFLYSITLDGAEDLAFDTIAASGKNSTVLHYNTNKDPIDKNGVILFDLGAQYNYYRADISRTYPASGKFSPRQAQIYDIVYRGQQEVLKIIKPGIKYGVMQDTLLDFYEVELKKIGLIKSKEEITKYYWHSVGHHLGLDTHDASYNRKDQILQKGMVVTCEPGLYLEEEGIGVRIEDDVLVTEDGCEVLSKDIIKSIKDIEDYINE